MTYIPGAGSGTIAVQDEGVSLTARSIIDFAGLGVTATDDAANSRTLVTIPGANAQTVASNVTRARIRQTSVQSIPNGAWTAVTMDTTDFDSDGLHSPSTNSRFVIQQSGTYALTGMLNIGTNATGERGASIFKNGAVAANRLAEVLQAATPAAFDTIIPIATGPVQLVAGDYVELFAYQNSGSAVNTDFDGGFGSWLGIERVDAGNVAYATGGSQLLGKQVYNPNPRVAAGSTSTAVVIADATNLKVTFIAPASGSVVVRLSATAYVYNNTANTAAHGYWCLCSDTTGTVVAGTVQQSLGTPATSIADQQQAMRVTTEMPVSGLTAGQSYTYWWGLFGDSATVTNDIIYGDNGTTFREGAAIMEVYDATVGTPNNSFPQNGITQPFLAVQQGALAADATNATFSYTKVDATQAAVTFIAPASGRVLITAQAVVFNASNGGVNLGVGQTAGVELAQVATSGGSASQVVQLTFVKTGLTSGQSYTYYLYLEPSSSGTAVVRASSYGNVVMYVQDAVLSPNMAQQSANPFLLAQKTYNPSSATAVTTASTTPNAVDATNLAVTFIAPASGSVLVRLQASANLVSGSLGGIDWGLLSGGTQLGAMSYVTASTVGLRCFQTIPVTGLTPRQQYTIQWAHASESGSTTVRTVYGGGNAVGSYGPAIMEVWDGTAGQGSVQTPPGLTTLGRFTGHAASAQSIPNITWTKLTGFTVDDDPLGKWDATNSQWVTPATGSYEINAAIGFAANSSGSRWLKFQVNGTDVTGAFENKMALTEGSGTLIELSRTLRLNVGDTVTVLVYQNSTAALSTLTGVNSSRLEIMQQPDTAHTPSATSASQVVGGRVYQSVAQSLPANTWTTLSWDTVDYDRGGYRASVAPTRLTVPTGAAGTYRVKFQMTTTNLANGAFSSARIIKNGSTVTNYGYDVEHAASAGQTVCSIGGDWDLNSGDYFEVQANVSPTTGVTSIAGVGLTFFELVRINSIALTDPTTTKGDTVVRSSGGALSRLSVGSNDQVAVADSTAALGVGYKWAIAGGTKAGFVSLKKAANQSIPNITWTVCQFDTETSDYEGMHDNVTNNSRITITVPGIYLVGGSIVYGTVSDQQRAITEIWKNGVTTTFRNEIDSSGVNGGPGLCVMAPLELVVGDYVEIATFHSSGGAQPVTPLFWAVRLLRTG